MVQGDNDPDPKARQGQQHRQELAPNLSTVSSGQNAGKAPAAQNTDTHPFPPCSTWLSAETLDMHCTVNDHRRHCSGFSRNDPAQRTVLVALDLTAAFDNVYHQQLLDCVFNTNIPATIRRWLYNYMQNRRVKVHFRQKESKSRKVKLGVGVH